MNAEMIFNKFAKMAEKDDSYYTFGKHGIIEDLLAWFNIPSEKFIGSNSVAHSNNLEKLHDFMISKATNDQLKAIAEFCETSNIPVVDISNEAAGNVFVSMPMNREKCNCIDEIRNGMREACQESNNIAFFLDQSAHSENIYNKMLENIRNCKFLIADLTTQNTGVYFEAGFAKALGKTVIFTCKKSDFDNIHFDVKQIQIIIWDDERDLSNKLAKQIRELNLGESK